MEILNIVGLLLIAATNLYIGIQVRNQKTTVEVPVPEVHVSVEAPVLQPAQPLVLESVDYDYTYLETILERLTELVSRPTHPALPVIIPNPQPYPYQGPYWQSPTVSDSTNDAEINGVPGKQFPAR